jgi:hypothetical protein
VLPHVAEDRRQHCSSILNVGKRPTLPVGAVVIIALGILCARFVAA